MVLGGAQGAIWRWQIGEGGKGLRGVQGQLVLLADDETTEERLELLEISDIGSGEVRVEEGGLF